MVIWLELMQSQKHKGRVKLFSAFMIWTLRGVDWVEWNFHLTRPLLSAPESRAGANKKKGPSTDKIANLPLHMLTWLTRNWPRRSARQYQIYYARLRESLNLVHMMNRTTEGQVTWTAHYYQHVFLLFSNRKSRYKTFLSFKYNDNTRQ